MICIDVPTFFTLLIVLFCVVYVIRLAIFLAVKREKEERYRSTLEASEATQFLQISRPGGSRELYLGRRKSGLYFLEAHYNTDGIPHKMERFYLTDFELGGIRRFRFQRQQLSQRQQYGDELEESG